MGNRLLAIVSLPKKLFLGPSKKSLMMINLNSSAHTVFNLLLPSSWELKDFLGTNKYVIKAINMLP